MAPPPPLSRAMTESSQESPSAYTLQDVNFGRLYKVATQTSKRVLKAVFEVVMVRARVAVVDVWPASVADYCSQVLGWSNTKFRQSFNPEERTLLQQPIEVADMDVSLLSKLMHKLFEEDLSYPDSLKRAIRDLKNTRNRVCHEHLLLDEKELAQNLNDLKGIYGALLDEVNEVFAVEMDDFRRMFYNEVDDIMSSAVMVEASEYFEKVEQFRTELVGRFITQGQRELMEHYIKLQILNPFTWLSSESFSQLQVGRIFTPLLIKNKCRTVDVASLLTTEMLNPETEEESGMLPVVLVLSGIAGCGKTSLCRFLVHSWRTHEGAVASLRSVDILLYIEARNVTSTTLVTFLQKSLLPNTCSHFEEKDILKALRQVTVLYVIDGMDEATMEAKQLLRDVFSSASGSRVLVTTRPEYASDVMQLAERHHLSHLQLAVHGFSDEGRKVFTSRVFTAFLSDEILRRRQEDEFLRFLRTSCKGLVGYLNLPLTLALLVCLWYNDKKRIAQITSATRLYSEIFRLCTTKMTTRLQVSAASLPLDMQSFVESWLLALGQEAYRMLEEGQLVIDDKVQRKLTGLCNAQGVASLQMFSAFLHCEVQAGLMGVHHNFSFVHKSQMEYLAAFYLSNEVLTASRASDTTDGSGTSTTSTKGVLNRFKVFRNSLKRETKNDIHDIILFSGWGAKWVTTWLFIVGHLCMSEAEDGVLQAVLDAIVSVPAVTHNEGTMWRLVEESGRHALVREKVAAAMTKCYNWRPTDAELCDASHPVVMLMQHTAFTPQSILLRVVGSVQGTLLLGEDGRPHTAPYENLTPILTWASKRPSCLIHLKLEEQYYTWGAKETGDHYLQLLEPDGNVATFQGHLRPAGAAALASITQMKLLKVRVSEVATLKALAEGVLRKPHHVERLTLRLDLPWSPPPTALPRLHSPAIDLVLHGVHDAVVAAAAQLMAELSQVFIQVDLVTSHLTPDGAETLLDALSDRKVAIEGALTVRSRHPLQEVARRRLEARVKGGGALHWWS